VTAHFHGSCPFRLTQRGNLVTQSVKEVLQSLVDDNLVQMDKIGSSNCKVLSIARSSPFSGYGGIQRRTRAAVFWSFPSQRGAIVSRSYPTRHRGYPPQAPVPRANQLY
jgi:hypothetical protein